MIARLDERLRATERDLAQNRADHQRLYDMLLPLSTVPEQLRALTRRFDSYVAQTHIDDNADDANAALWQQVAAARASNVRAIAAAGIMALIAVASMIVSLIAPFLR